MTDCLSVVLEATDAKTHQFIRTDSIFLFGEVIG